MKELSAITKSGMVFLLGIAGAMHCWSEESSVVKSWQTEGGNTNVQNVFFTPTWKPAQAWGEPAVNYHNGLYTMIYDYFPTPLPLVLATSRDGVYWQDQGPVFEKDEDVKDIQCAYIERFKPDGPWVMQYAYRKSGSTHRMRFATSEDLVNWKRLGVASDFVPDPRWYTSNRWDTIVPWPKGDGIWYGMWNAISKGGFGFGFGASTDGIHWNVLPPVRVLRPDLGGGELGGFFKIGDRYFIVFSGLGMISSRDEVTAFSDRPEGPYRPTPKNNFRAENPFIYARCYNLPGGIFSAEMLWIGRKGGRTYNFPLLKKVEREGESLWLKWWAGNDKLKVHPLTIGAAEKNTQIGQCLRFDLPEKFDLSKGTVVEGTIRLPEARKNLACGAAVTASSTKQGVEPLPDFFDAKNAVDSDLASYWMPDCKTGDVARLQVDLGEPCAIGSIRIDGRGVRLVELSLDAQTWKVCSPACEQLAAKSRYVRITVGKDGVGKLAKDAKISNIGIYQEPSERAGYADSGVAGLMLEDVGARHYAMLIARDGSVRFGTIDKDGRHFRILHERNIDVAFDKEARFRLILRGDMGELYLNDYQVSPMNLACARSLTGQLGFFGFDAECPVKDLKAWNSDPANESRR